MSAIESSLIRFEEVVPPGLSMRRLMGDALK